MTDIPTTLSTRAKSACWKLNVTTIEALSQYDREEVKNTKGVGAGTLKEFDELLEAWDLTWGMKPEGAGSSEGRAPDRRSDDPSGTPEGGSTEVAGSIPAPPTTCSTCKYHSLKYHGCVRYPPQVGGRFPRVDLDMWCGEFDSGSMSRSAGGANLP